MIRWIWGPRLLGFVVISPHSRSVRACWDNIVVLYSIFCHLICQIGPILVSFLPNLVPSRSVRASVAHILSRNEDQGSCLSDICQSLSHIVSCMRVRCGERHNWTTTRACCPILSPHSEHKHRTIEPYVPNNVWTTLCCHPTLAAYVCYRCAYAATTRNNTLVFHLPSKREHQVRSTCISKRIYEWTSRSSIPRSVRECAAYVRTSAYALYAQVRTQCTHKCVRYAQVRTHRYVHNVRTSAYVTHQCVCCASMRATRAWVRNVHTSA